MNWCQHTIARLIDFAIQSVPDMNTCDADAAAAVTAQQRWSCNRNRIRYALKLPCTDHCNDIKPLLATVGLQSQ